MCYQIGFRIIILYIASDFDTFATRHYRDNGALVVPMGQLMNVIKLCGTCQVAFHSLSLLLLYIMTYTYKSCSSNIASTYNIIPAWYR